MAKAYGMLGRVALAVILFAGAAVIWLVAAGIAWSISATIGGTIVRHVGHNEMVATAEVTSRLARESLVVFRDGTPAIKTSIPRTPDSYRSLDGKPLKPNETELHFRDGVSLTVPRGDLSGMEWKERIAADLVDQHPEADRWYFIHDGQLHGRGYFVVYDRTRWFPVAYVGRSGAMPAPPLAEQQFPVDGRRMMSVRWWVHEAVLMRSGVVSYILTDEGLAAIDLSHKVVRLVFKRPGVRSGGLAGFALGEPSRNRFAYDHSFLIRDGQYVYAVDENGGVGSSYPIPAELRERSFEVYEFDKSSIMAIDVNHVVWFDTAGKVTRQARVALEHPEYNGVDEWFPVFLFPIPSFYAIGPFYDDGVWSRTWTEIRHTRPAGWAGFWQAVWSVWPLVLSMASVLLVSAVLAALAYRQQRRYALECPWLWAVLVFMGGVPGYLAYRVHRDWPARIACPACGKPAPRDRENCLACGKPFPVAGPKGIEVFA
jgi:hypothetical protein